MVYQDLVFCIKYLLEEWCFSYSSISLKILILNAKQWDYEIKNDNLALERPLDKNNKKLQFYLSDDQRGHLLKLR